MESTRFGGCANESAEEFIEQFQALAVFKKCNTPEEQLLLLPSFLKGSALSYFRTIKNTCKTSEEALNKLKEEFGETDYSELFYSAKQEQKSLSEFYYHLSELASKASINKDATFVTQFLKGLKPFFKSKLANSHFPNKQALKGVINQIEKVYPQNREEQTNITMNPAALQPIINVGGGSGDGAQPTPYASPMTTPSQDVRRADPGPSASTPQQHTPSHPYNLRFRSRNAQPNFRHRRH